MKIIYKAQSIYKMKKCCFNSFFAAYYFLLLLTALSCNLTPAAPLSEETKKGEAKFKEDQKTIEGSTGKTQEITDVSGRKITIPENVDNVICSGAGCLRLLTYLNAHDRIIAVDGIEVRGSPIDARPYAIANPQFKTYPVFGEFRGYDNPELIAGLDPQPKVIFKMQPGGGINPDMLRNKTGIPVITLTYGNLTFDRHILDHTLRLMAEVINKQHRAEEVISFFDELMHDLKIRTPPIPSSLTFYIGGLGQSGPHGIQSTDPSYAPFSLLGLRNIATPLKEAKPISYLNVAKEQIIVWDPDIIFLDISTLRLGADINALDQLRNDPSFKELRAVKNQQVYGLFPNYSYNQNFEVVLANAYFIGKIIYPESFSDINPIEKAEEISEFLNGKPSFGIMNEMFGNMGFTKISIE